MKFLAALFLISFPFSGTSNPPSLGEQTQALYKQLWNDEKMFGFQNIYIVMNVKHPQDMHEKNVWGDVHFDKGYPEIDIMALEDYPAQMPMKERKVQQRQVLRHELLHIKMEQLGVPGEAQDTLIEALQPYMKEN